MTTDITELAQSLKAAATDVKETAHIARYVKATIARQTFKELMTPENILALVEALEKAQQHIARQEQIILNQDESLSIRRGELEAAQQERENWRTSFDNERFRADKLASVLNDEIEQAANVRGQLLIAHKTLLNQQARIAELESRTVKLPHLPDDCDRADANFYYMKALDDAGIKWEAE